MTPRWRWTLLWLLLSAVLPAAHVYWRVQVGPDSALLFRMVWSGLYLPFGILLLGVLARWHPAGNVNSLRISALLVGALYAAGEVWMVVKGFRSPGLEIWMAALLGLSVSLMLPRVLPEIWLRRWLGLERRARMTEPGKTAAR